MINPGAAKTMTAWLRPLIQKRLLKRQVMGISLAVQWLGLHAFIVEHSGSFPGQGTEIPQATQSGQKRRKRQVMGKPPDWFSLGNKAALFFLPSLAQPWALLTAGELSHPGFIQRPLWQLISALWNLLCKGRVVGTWGPVTEGQAGSL